MFKLKKCTISKHPLFFLQQSTNVWELSKPAVLIWGRIPAAQQSSVFFLVFFSWLQIPDFKLSIDIKLYDPSPI